MDKTAYLTRCPRCGNNLPADMPEGLCPACLSAIAIAGSPTLASQGETVSAVPPITQRHSVVQEPTGPTPGHTFGPYHIERLLGRGGMGDVYEADHIEQGRRVALKVLHQHLSGREDRARFLREGQLAASINHPHTVYIFGSDEIDGIPAITMELLPGGTLKDRVKERGPLQPAAAVDAILQVIAGLEALHAVGVLHRDVKPANCFVDSDGTVKVGDFGLSISTMARDVSQLTITGAFLGTPQFAAPEQLKGYPLDVRSDIYAVGATLYFLLTGRAPFEDTNLLAIVARIATEAPPSPRTVMPRVPRGLANIVLSCLAKDAADRPADYVALNDALRPFSSATPAPATLGLRLIAWAIDAALLSALTGWFNISQSVKLFAPDGAAQDPFSPRWGVYVALFAIRIAYYGVQEGRWGASPGKRLLGLRVVIAGGGQPPGVARASWRALIFSIPTISPTILAPLFLDPRFMLTLLLSEPWAPLVNPLLLTAEAALLFSTARRRNGFAGVHELWTRTRVIHQLATLQRPSLESVRERSIVVGSSLRRVGPFDVIDTVGRTAIGTLSVGYDPRLQRRVWLHEQPVGAPPVASLVRDLKRPGRLRWLSDRRTSTERWDAYEALDGLPLVTLLDRPRPWRDVRQWLADLAQEIEAGLSDGSLGRLALDCVWITRDGRAKLLDFQVPGAVTAPGPFVPATAHTAPMFLGELATSALTGSKGVSSALGQRLRHSLPVSASALLDALAGPIGNWSDVVQRTTALLKGPDRVERWRRAASIGLACSLPVGLFVFMAAMTSMVLPVVRASMTPENARLTFVIGEVSLPSTSRDPAYRAALETYIAGRFGPLLADPRFGTTPQTMLFLRDRRLIERIVADHPQVSPDQMAAATAVLSPSFERHERFTASSQSMSLWSMSNFMLQTTFAITAVVAILLAWLFRGGFLLHALDIVVVTKTGQPASRLRALWRGFVAWGIFLAPVLFLLLARPGLIRDPRLGIGECIIGLMGAAWAVVCPERGLQDRIAGTYLVPR